MRKNYFFFVTFIFYFSTIINAQKTYIPDDNFEQALIDLNIDKDGIVNDSIATADISSITTLNVDSKNISDLTGIEDFKMLKNLHCTHNLLTSIDISKNTELEYLYLYVNQLTSIDISQNKKLLIFEINKNEISTLDISNNTELTQLALASNQVTQLDISNNTNLSLINFFGNLVTSIDLSKNTKLTILRCGDNQLTSLDVSKNLLLEEVSCFVNKISSLDFTLNTKLTNINFNVNEVSNIDVSKNTLITYLGCSRNKLSTIDISQNTLLTYFYGGSNLFTTLDLSKNTALINLNCMNNQLTNLDVSKNTALTTIYCNANQIANLDLSNNTALTTIYCDENQIANLDLSNNTALTSLICGYNKLTSINVNNNNLLTKLSANNNQLTSLDLSDQKSLTYLACYNNQLNGLNVKNGNNLNMSYFSALNNPDLTCIQVDDATAANAGQAPYDVWQKDQAISYSEDCSGSDTTSIPDSKFEQALIDLGILTDNTVDGSVDKTEISVVTNLNISGLDISDLSGIEDFTSLETLIVSNNQLTYLDLRNNLNLRFLNVSGNPLVTLLVADDDLLKYDNNKSTQQAATNNNFTELNITDTQLDTIALSGLPHLEIFKAQNSKLASLDVSGNGDLTTMDIRNNPLTCINVSQTQMNSIPSDWQKDVSASYNTDCQAQLGIDDETLNKGLILYPNPVSDRLNIVSELPLTKVEFFSVLGQRVKEIHTDFHSIPTGNLSKGIYFIRVYSDKGIAVKKLIRK